jgi:hypothetical protein
VAHFSVSEVVQFWMSVDKDWDAVHPGVVAEPVTGHAELAAAGLEQGALIEVGPLLNWSFKPRD